MHAPSPNSGWHRLVEAALAVPVFSKIMGIALGLTLFYGLVTFWQIRVVASQSYQLELQTQHSADELQLIDHHIQLETAALQRRLARVMSIMAGAGMLFAWLLTRILTRPLNELLQLTRRIQQGDLTVRVPVRSQDEVGDLATAFNEMTAELAQKEAARQHLLRQVIASQEAERKRVARELHDETGQSLTSLIAGLTALENGDPRVGKLRQLAERTLGEVHDLSVALRPSVLDDLGLGPALKKHCETVAQRHGVKVNCDAVGMDKRLPAELETALYRIVQEALNNAIKHGQATQISVLLQRKNATLLLVVEDDGRGFAAETWREDVAQEQRLGLRGIEERAALWGGALRIQSNPDTGTSLFVELPS